MLIEARFISKEQLLEALSFQKQKNVKLGAALIELGYLKERDFTSFLARVPGIASIDLLSYEIPRELARVIPHELAAKYELIPLDKLKGSLSVAMACPLDRAAIEEVSKATGLKIRPLLSTRGDILVAIRRYYAQEADRLNHIFKLAEHSERGLQAIPEETRERPQTEDAAAKEILETVETEKTDRDLQSLTLLPMRSATAGAIRAAMTTTALTAERLADIVVMDPGATANVLSLANDGEHGFSHQVAALDFAVALVGLRNVARRLLSAPALDSTEAMFDSEAFSVQSLCSASIAKIVVKLLGSNETETAFTAGLLHNIGDLALHTLAPHMFSLIDRGLAPAELCHVERELLGVCHAEAGGQLADKWLLPASVADAIRHHHEPFMTGPHASVVTAVAIAAYFCTWDIQDEDRRKQTLTTVDRWLKRFPGATSLRADSILKAIHLDDIQRHWRERWAVGTTL